MAETQEKHICLGILAHVDAGKTTLSESILYKSGSIRKMGRVDHRDAFLDTFELEKERGITIFSKQALFSWKGMEVTLLDTPGHVDFSAETERVLQVLDCAVLVVSGADGIQGHTETLWKLLKRYGIPVFIFVNKMDQNGTDRDALMAKLRSRFGEGCVDFGTIRQEGGRIVPLTSSGLDDIAVCDDGLTEEYLETGSLSVRSVSESVMRRRVFPCRFGSALLSDGVEELLDDLAGYVAFPAYPSEFAAKVYKIARDSQGNRLTYVKVTGGSLKVKDVIEGLGEKVNQIRIYSGAKFELAREVAAGRVCAVTGLDGTYPGQGLGGEGQSEMPVLEPVLTFRVLFDEELDAHTMLKNLRQLEEEEPQLHIVWEEQTGEIHAQLMGEVQTEILCRLIKDRFGVRVQFVEGAIVYKETVENVVEGVGHYEPLRHYAEVHLLLEPAERGSGMHFESRCREDVLDRNWQRLILTHLEEKEHRGVVLGSPVTDMKITLLSGRAHLKHTEGGDFRQATYRAVRQGLMKARTVLLEPYYSFRMELPSECVGRAMNDIQRMYGKCEGPFPEGNMSVLTGTAPVSAMRGYQTEFTSYTGGRGVMSCVLKGYDRCHNEEEVRASSDYNPDSDLENPSGSVFCAHGAGFVVPWDEVEEYMHLESGCPEQDGGREVLEQARENRRHTRIELTQEELDAIYYRTPDPTPYYSGATTIYSTSEEGFREKGISNGKWDGRRRRPDEEEYLLVDGYNIIFAWDELRELSEKDVGGARDRLADILCNYQGYKDCTLILVFDAYKVEGNPGSVAKYNNIYIVYTKEAETADQYIEKTVRHMAGKGRVTVATSDGLEQVIILGQGAHRMSADGLKEEVESALKEMRGEIASKESGERNYLFDYLGEEDARKLERIRLGKNNKENKKNTIL